MDWAQVFQSKFTWLALGAGVAAVGYTVYRGIRGGTDGSGGAGGLSDGEMPASHSGNVVATPEIRRSSTSDRSATAGRNSRNTTPVLASARTGGSAPDGIPVMSLEHEVPSDTEGDAVVIPRVVEEHEHHAEIVMQPPEGELTSRQVRNGDLCLTTLGLPNGSMAVAEICAHCYTCLSHTFCPYLQMVLVMLAFILIAFLTHVLQVSSGASSVFSSLGFTAAGVLAVMTSPQTFGMSSSRGGEHLEWATASRRDRGSVRVPVGKPRKPLAGSHKVISFPVADHATPPLLPQLPVSPDLGRRPAGVSGGASSGIVDDTAILSTGAMHPPSDALKRADELAEAKQCDDSDAVLKAELPTAGNNKERAGILWRLAKNQFLRASLAAVGVAPVLEGGDHCVATFHGVVTEKQPRNSRVTDCDVQTSA
jgi:hypothetical protein